MLTKVMAAVMDPITARLSVQDVQAIMGDRTGRIFEGMGPEDRTAFMESMVGTCVSKATEGLDDAQRARLAEAVLGRLGDRLREIRPERG